MDTIDQERTRRTPSVVRSRRDATDDFGVTGRRAASSSGDSAPATAIVPRAATTTRAPAVILHEQSDAPAPVIVPGRAVVPTHAVAPRRPARPILSNGLRYAAVLVGICVAVSAALTFALRPTASNRVTGAISVPPPSGRGPVTATIGVVLAAPPPLAVHSSQAVSSPAQYTTTTTKTTSTGGSVSAQGNLGMEPCHDSVMFVPNISQWSTPPGCYANVYIPNTANYPSRPGFGYCNWWVRVTHAGHYDITENTSYPRGTTPVAGAAIFFDPFEQGAGSDGHWAEAVAVAPDHYWVLISEMNFAWRGAGFGRIEYRYIHVSPHVHFVYGV